MALEGMTMEQIETIAALTKSITDNPKTRLQWQALVKQAHPDVSTPELDQAIATQELHEKLESVSNEFTSYKEQAESEKRELREWGDVIGAKLCTYDDIAEVQKFMTENGIVNKMFGAKSWASSKQIAEPTSATIQNSYAMPQNFIQKWKEAGSKGLAQMARDEAHIALQDFRSGKAG
jgi:hypothetical protein